MGGSDNSVFTVVKEVKINLLGQLRERKRGIGRMCNINAHILSINKINIRTIICTKFLCAMSFANYLLRNFLPKITVQQNTIMTL